MAPSDSRSVNCYGHGHLVCKFPINVTVPYLAFAAMLMAGLDGIQSRINPGEPIDKNLYELPPAERAEIPVNPRIAG